MTASGNLLNDMSKKKRQEKIDQKAIVINTQNIVPKFCNIINFGELNNKSILMTFLFKEPTNDQTVLLERFLIDKEHAKKVVEVLTNLLK